MQASTSTKESRNRTTFYLRSFIIGMRVSLGIITMKFIIPPIRTVTRHRPHLSTPTTAETNYSLPSSTIFCFRKRSEQSTLQNSLLNIVTPNLLFLAISMMEFIFSYSSLDKQGIQFKDMTVWFPNMPIHFDLHFLLLVDALSLER